MKVQAERTPRVVVLSDYRKQKDTQKKKPSRDPAKVLDEVSYHLAMAARAMMTKN